MKLKILFFLTALCIISCSDNNYTPVNEKELRKVSMFYNDGDENADASFLFYENRLVEINRHVNNETSTLYSCSYWEENMYISSYHYYSGSNSTVDASVYYDSQNRISTIYVHEPLSVFTEKAFDYSVPGKITMNQVVDDGFETEESQTIYSLDTYGRIYKITVIDGNGGIEYISEADYNGDALALVTNTYYSNGNIVKEETIPYNYNTSMEVKGAYNNLLASRCGTDVNSILLHEKFEVFKENYIESYGNMSFEYEFDQDGFPIKEKVYNNGVLSYYKVITYY